jgi:hypothetical protein
MHAYINTYTYKNKYTLVYTNLHSGSSCARPFTPFTTFRDTIKRTLRFDLEKCASCQAPHAYLPSVFHNIHGNASE